MDFNNFGYQIVREAISKQTAELAATEFKMLRDHFPDSVNDNQVEKAFWWYGSFVSESILTMMLPKVEEVIGVDLYPSYSYGRIYYNGAEMVRHTDRRSCEYSATVSISIDTPWAIWFKDASGKENALQLNVGDMCVYKGTELEHWREQYDGNEHIQFFLHYVDQNGIYKDFKYDKRDMLGLPSVGVGE